jgi:hypothetical protein
VKRYLTVSLAALVIWGLAGTAGASWRGNECRFRSLEGPSASWSVREVKLTIRCAADRFHIDVDKALTVAEHESGFQANAGDSHCGIYQHDRSSFPSRIDGARARWPRYAWYGGRCENARSNIFAAFDLVKDTGGWYDHWCRWATYC